MKKMLLTILTVFIISFMAISQTNTPSYINPYPKTITVTGSAEMEIIPDEIFVQVDLREYEKRGSGKIDIETIRVKFLNACKSIGVSDSSISIASYQGMDRLYWLYKKRKAPDMTASISYLVKFNNTKLVEALIEKLDDEATQNFFIAKTSHSKMETYRKQLKIQAIKASRDKADYLAEAVGEKIGEAISIQEPLEKNEMPFQNFDLASNALMRNQVNAGENIAGGSGVDFKKIKIKFEINTVFALK
ncbi:MAG: SIMPL domain-containing protein [Agriterribacter sp.]